MLGCHLEQIAADEWVLRGLQTVNLKMVESKDNDKRQWEVSSDGQKRGTWQVTASALAHAYALACGQSSI